MVIKKQTNSTNIICAFSEKEPDKGCSNQLSIKMRKGLDEYQPMPRKIFDHTENDNQKGEFFNNGQKILPKFLIRQCVIS